MKCVYCKKEIINFKRPNKDKNYLNVYKSSEHIIQNALGGKLQSNNICCDRCNYHIERIIDKKFCDIFAPFTSNIKDFRKTSNSSSEPPYSGYALYNDEGKNKIAYVETIKNSKVKRSQEIIENEKKKGQEGLHKRINDQLKNARVIFNNFDLDNKYFKQGLSKIAYNYAVSKGIKIDNICKVELGGEYNELQDIVFNTVVIPFVPGNELDEFIELQSEFFLFHNLILFSYFNELWCYINLFNTFQFYVRLSNNYHEKEKCRYKIYGEEFQYVQSNTKYKYKSFKEVIMEKAYGYILFKEKNDMSYNFYFKNNELNRYFTMKHNFSGSQKAQTDPIKLKMVILNLTGRLMR